MKIKTSVQLNIEKKGSNIIVYELQTLCLILGSAGVSGNYHIYNVKRQKDHWVVPIKIVKERIKFIERRIAKQEKYLEIMKQVVK